MKAIEKADETRIAQSSAPSLPPTIVERIQILAMTASEDRASIEMHIATTCSLRDSLGPDDTGIEGLEESAILTGENINIRECKEGVDDTERRSDVLLSASSSKPMQRLMLKGLRKALPTRARRIFKEL
jgi:hypothetical protein